MSRPYSNIQSPGLPAEEYKKLIREQNRGRLEKHFEQHGDSISTNFRPNPYRDAGLSYEERYRLSQIRSATKAALGPSFAFAGIDNACYSKEKPS